MRRVFVIAALVAALPATAHSTARGGDYPSIWSGLVLAKKEEHPRESSPELKSMKKRLEASFAGYNEFELIGEHAEKIDDPDENWLIPSKDFCLHVASKSKAGDKAYLLKLVLFQNKRQLAEFETKLG